MATCFGFNFTGLQHVDQFRVRASEKTERMDALSNGRPFMGAFISFQFPSFIFPLLVYFDFSILGSFLVDKARARVEFRVHSLLRLLSSRAGAGR